MQQHTLRSRQSSAKALRPLIVLVLLGALLGTGCQEKSERTVSLTQEQWKRVKNNVSDEAPKPGHPINAIFGRDGQPIIELVGWTMEPEALVTGKPFELTWFWKSLAKTEVNWKIFVHLQPKSRGAFQNLDHHPVDNLYQTSLWEPGSYITDTQSTSLQAGFSSSGGYLHIGLYDARSGDRLELLDVGNGTEVEEGKLRVGEVGTKNDKELVAYKVTEAPVLDGELDDAAWRVAGRTASFVNAADGKAVNFATTAKALYTDEALYLALDARDTDIQTSFTKRDDRLWEQDCVEVYLNPDNDDGTYWELQISPGDGVDGKAPIFDAYFEKHRTPAWKIAMKNNLPGLEAVVHRRGTLNSGDKKADDTGYTVEVKIPFATLGNTPGAIDRIRLPDVPPKEGATWRINFFRVDLQKTGVKDTKGHASWSPSGGDFHNLEAFGTLRFGEAKDPQARRPQPQTETRVRATVVSHGKGIAPASLTKTTQNAEPKFLDCIDMGGPRPEKLTTVRFKVEVDAAGAVTEVLRPTSPLFAAAAIDCMVDEIELWTVDRKPHRPSKPLPKAVAPVPPVGEPAAEPKGEADKPEQDPDMPAGLTIEPTTFAVKVLFSPATSSKREEKPVGNVRPAPRLGVTPSAEGTRGPSRANPGTPGQPARRAMPAPGKGTPGAGERLGSPKEPASALPSEGASPP